jgi:hypothetical protein
VCSAVRKVAEPALVVGAHRDFARAPRFERTHQNRRRERRAHEHQLLKDDAFNRAESAKKCDEKRDWQDWRHCPGPSGNKPSRLSAPAVGNVVKAISVPAPMTCPQKITYAPLAALEGSRRNPRWRDASARCWPLVQTWLISVTNEEIAGERSACAAAVLSQLGDNP